MSEQMKVYPVDDKRLNQIKHSFTYHSPQEDQVPRYNYLRQKAGELAIDILNLVPSGREQSLAITKLEEAIMWANKGIARGE